MNPSTSTRQVKGLTALRQSYNPNIKSSEVQPILCSNCNYKRYSPCGCIKKK